MTGVNFLETAENNNEESYPNKVDLKWTTQIAVWERQLLEDDLFREYLDYMTKSNKWSRRMDDSTRRADF